MKSNSFGRSFTDKEHIKRKLKVRQKRAVSTTSEEYSKFLTKDPNALIAAYVSIIDKIYNKPKTGVASKTLFQLRDDLAGACWPHVEKRINQGGSTASDYTKRWAERIHPYREYMGKDDQRERFASTDERNKKGRWYETLAVLGKDGKKIDPKLTAERINAHLFEGKIPIRNTRIHPHPHGLVQKQALAVEQSLPLNAVTPKTLDWNDNDEEIYLSRFRPAEKIIEVAKEAEREDKKNKKYATRLSTQEVGRILFDGYADVFGGENQIPPHRTELEKSPDNKRLLNLHHTIREYFKRTIKSSLKGTKSQGDSGRQKALGDTKRAPLSRSLPKTSEDLLRRLKQRNDNKNTNRMIRQGRLLYYSGYRGDTTPPDELKLIYLKSSAGQAEIKRNEAFVRVWRSSIAQAARTARSLAKTPDEFEDVTDGNTINAYKPPKDGDREKLPSHFDEVHTFEKYRLLFGGAAEKFPNANEEPVKLIRLLHSTLRVFAQCRHGVFHFNSRQGFVEALKDNVTKKRSRDGAVTWELPENIAQIFQTVLSDDMSARAGKMVRNLEAVHLNFYACSQQMQGIWDALNQDAESDVILPKFHNVLGHMQDLKKHSKAVKQCKSFPQLSLPPKPNATELKDPATLCRYATLKYLFEGPFRNHLDQNPSGNIDKFIDEILERGEKRAKNANARKMHSNFITAKANKLPRPDGVGIAEYFHKLDAEMATVMRVQKGYNPDPEAAREKSEYIVDFQRELICSLFLEYLNNKDFGWLTKLAKGTPLPQNPKAKLPKPQVATKSFDDWEAAVYFILHLVPVNDLSLLLHQYRKWRVLSEEDKAPNAKSHSPEEQDIALKQEDQLRFLFALCIEMQNDKMDGAATFLETEEIKGLFQNPNDFDRVFGLDDALVQSTKRGLREILRMGHMQTLMPIFQTQRIPTKKVDLFLEAERKGAKGISPIAAKQKQRIELHDKAVDDPGNFNTKAAKEYLLYTKEIASHRNLAANVRLTNFVHCHNILMRVAGRLVDFAGSWERDLYFITLAVLHDKNITFDKALPEITDEMNARQRQSRRKAIENFQSGKVQTNKLKPEHEQEIGKYFPCDIDTRNIRNAIDHFKYLSAGSKIDLTQQLNNTRHLLRYDRKLKNAVSKAIADLLAREGLYVKWSMQRNETGRHILKAERIETKTIQHMGKIKSKLNKIVEPIEEVTWWDRRKKVMKSRNKQVKDIFNENSAEESIVSPELRALVEAIFGIHPQK